MDSELEEILGTKFSIFIDSPDKLVIDQRTPICCKFYCQNYGKKCYCPPHCLNPEQFTTFKEKYKTLIILARCISPNDWTYVKKSPLNEFNPKKHKVYFRRWAQITTWSLYKKIFKRFPTSDNSFFMFGTSLNRCYNCKITKKNCKSGIAWPSPEALGVDIPKTMKKFDYNVKFGVERDIIRVGMILTNQFQDYIGYKKMNLPSTQTFQDVDINQITDSLSSITQIEKIIQINPKKIISKSRIRYDYWKKAILWKLNKNYQNKKIYNKIKNKVHEKVFMNNKYFCLSINNDDILNKDQITDIKNGIFGIELVE